MGLGNATEFDRTAGGVRPDERFCDGVRQEGTAILEANDIPEEKQVAVLLSTVGGRTYELLRDLLALTPPKETSFDEIVAVLRQHFEPKPLVIVEKVPVPSPTAGGRGVGGRICRQA